MAHLTRPMLFLLGLAATIAACSGSTRQDEDDSSGGSRAVTSSISGCTGTYTCTLYGPPFATDTLDLSQAAINGTTFNVDGVPDSDEYLFCWPPSATCTGAAKSCYSLELEACDYQDGCDAPIGFCEGDVTDCSALDYEDDCHRQRGCTWQ